MNKKYKKILVTGLALNMMLVNIPYNVFANSDMIENIMLNEDNVPLIGEQDKSGLVIESEQTLNDEDLTIDESDSSYINNDVVSELPEPIIKEDYSSVTENNISENVSNSVTNFTEDEKIAKSTMPSVTNYADSFAGGDGSEENPYQISNTLELARLAYLINEEDLDTTGMYFELIDDIDLSDFDSDNDSDNGNWIPIGYLTSTPSSTRITFKGNFNGNDYKISNMVIKEHLEAGLFGVVENAIIENLNISNCNITNAVNSGIFVGYSYGNLVINNIDGIENSIVIDSAKGDDINIGGIVGCIDHTRFYNPGSYFEIEDVKLGIDMNIKINDGYTVGGLVGRAQVYNIIVKNIDIDSSVIGLKSYDLGTSMITMNKDVGGLIGRCNLCYYSGDLKSVIEFIEISINLNIIDADNEFKYKDMRLAGFISTISEYSNIYNVIMKNIDINLNNDTEIVFDTFSPFIASALHLNLNIEDINVKSESNISAIDSVGGVIADSWYNSVKAKNVFVDIDSLNSDFYCGGFIGDFAGNKNLYVDNFNYKGKLTSKNRIFSFGGIVGYSNSLNNVEILNSNVDITIESPQYDYCGAIAGRMDFSNSSIFKNNIFRIKSEGSEWGIGGLFGYSNVENGVLVDIINNEIYIDIDSTYGTVPSGGLVGNLNNKGIVKIKDNFIIGDINTQSDTVGYAFGRIDNKGKLEFSNMYFALNLNCEALEDKDTYLYNSMKGNEILYNNIYYDSTISVLPDSLISSLTTEQMQGLNAKNNMPFDYDNIWKLNKEYYPTFNQLNTAPELSGNDIELIQNQEYDLLNYVTVEDFEDKDLVPEVTTNLDITKIGKYTATFTIEDPKGLSDELTLNIKVVAESPVINAKDLTLYVGDKFNPLDEVTAIDINGNDITEHIKVIENTVDTTKKGAYKVVYQVDSLERLSTTKEIKVTVLEKEVGNNNSNNNSNKVESDKNESSTIDKPQTGDNFMIYGISLLISLGGLLYVNRKSKKED